MESNLNSLLQKTIRFLAVFLEKALPPLFDDWWNEAVINSLSFQQRRRISEQGVQSLTSLDLASLLRVLDQNWYQLSSELN